jgi:hypothetical protein
MFLRPRCRHSSLSHSTGAGGFPRSVCPQQQPMQTETWPITRRWSRDGRSRSSGAPQSGPSVPAFQFCHAMRSGAGASACQLMSGFSRCAAESERQDQDSSRAIPFTQPGASTPAADQGSALLWTRGPPTVDQGVRPTIEIYYECFENACMLALPLVNLLWPRAGADPAG